MRNYPVQMYNADDSISGVGRAIFVGQAVAGSFSPLSGDLSVGGTMKIQASNDIPVGDPAKYTPVAATWIDIPSVTTTIASGVGPLIPYTNLCYQYIRAVFTHSSSGTTTIQLNASLFGV